MGRRWNNFLPLVAVLGAAAGVLPALASSETTPAIEAVNEGAAPYPEIHRWSPAQATVLAGGVVSFSNPGSEVPHGIEWVSGPDKPSCSSGVPVGTTEAASGVKWSGTCSFAQPGAYTFYCTVHHAKMSGTITVQANGTTTVAPTPTTTTTATPLPTESPRASPLLGGPSLRSSQRGGSVKGTLEISKAGSGEELEIDVFATRASLARKHGAAHVRVGRMFRSSVSAGRLTFAIRLDAAARRALARRHRLALTVKLVLTPVYGETTRFVRLIVEHG